MVPPLTEFIPYLPENGSLRWPLLPVLDLGRGMDCGELGCFSETTLGGINAY